MPLTNSGDEVMRIGSTGFARQRVSYTVQAEFERTAAFP
jgi:hypothetical protein